MSRPLQGGTTVAALILIPLLAVAGSDGIRAAFDFTTGVLTLVSLTAAVAWGLLATDRLFLSTRQRLLCQGIHRAAAVTSLGFLLLHGTVKVALGHVGLIGALIPFGTGVSGTAGLIGFGSLAGLLMIVTAATGAMRSAFATPGRIAGRWRALHALAYPAWCSALVHGLYAGRQPATWVVVMYILCLLAVAAALCLRLLPGPAKRLVTELITDLIGSDGPPQTSDTVVRSSPLPGADHTPPQPRRGLPPDAPGWGDDDFHDRGVRGTPVRPRTLTAPSFPTSGTDGHESTAYAAKPYGQQRYEPEPHTRAPYTEPPYEQTRPEQPPYEPLRHEPPPYEPPPRGSDRLGPGPSPGAAAGPRPGISAAYRAVSRPSARPPEGVDGRWPAPSPAPPAQAPGPGHTPYPPPPASGQETEQLPPGPLYPPPPGAPWHAPAGDRP